MSTSIRVRLTTWYAALLTVVILGLGTFLVLQLQTDLRRAVEGQALASSTTLIHDIADGPEEIEANSLLDLTEDAKGFERAARAALPTGGAAQVLDSQGRVLARYGAVAGDEPLVSTDARRAAEGGPGTFTARLGKDQESYRVRVTAFVDHSRGVVLVVAVSLQPVEDAVQRVLVLLLIAGPAALAVTALGAYWLAYRALRPLERMTSDAQEIGTDRLHERVAVPAASDEVGHLALTLNAMLDRIERGVLDKRRLVADASHELRTPLAVMRAEIDVSLRGDELSPAAREVLHSAVDEVDRMGRTVDNLLTLAEVEQDRLELLTVRVGLRQAIEDGARPLRTLAAAKGVTLVLEGGRWDAQADPHRLHLALTNLIENAIKFTPAGGSVHVLTWQREGEVGVTVTDDGPGVPHKDREHLFDRFYRVDSARGSKIEGSGLGLAICREVALAHGGRIWVDSKIGQGSAFSLALPGWRSLPSMDAEWAASSSSEARP